mgnify:CR=1 FL=1
MTLQTNRDEVYLEYLFKFLHSMQHLQITVWGGLSCSPETVRTRKTQNRKNLMFLIA